MKRLILTSLLTGFAAVACQDRKEAPPPTAGNVPRAAGVADGLSAFQAENGIGPVTEKLQLAAVDAALADKGRQVFETKCSACHKLDERYVGPALGEVLKRRTPEYAMNMMLNPAEMTQKHPTAKGVFAEFMVQMPFQNVTVDESRAILEFLRKSQKG